jgi:hypothetical protein
MTSFIEIERIQSAFYVKFEEKKKLNKSNDSWVWYTLEKYTSLRPKFFEPILQGTVVK